MEIPYTVTARKDTGLWNAKLGIWLFLASEVMLFGGLFSSYVFLRLGADYPWPQSVLTVWPGLVNTFVLIGSSVTVVFAWSSLKLRQYGRYKIYMAITILCAAIFMVLKGYEYYGKFTHHGVELTDGTLIDGHIEKDKVVFDVNSITFDPYGLDYEVIANSVADGKKLSGLAFKDKNEAAVTFDDKLRDKLIAKIEKDRAEAKKLADLKSEATGKTHLPGDVPSSVTLTLDPPAKFSIDPGNISLRRWTDEAVKLHDKTVLSGTIDHEGSKLVIKADKLSLRGVEFDKGLENRKRSDLDNSLAWKYFEGTPAVKETFFKHYDKELKESERLIPVEAEVISFAEKDLMVEKSGKEEGIELAIDRRDIRFYSNHGPKHNNYYGIYFTLTGLHGLHVVGGALVLTYFLLFGRKLYEKDPEHLANRVEVGGLFWHFVDLVWIFLFPLLYLL